MLSRRSALLGLSAGGWLGSAALSVEGAAPGNQAPPDTTFSPSVYNLVWTSPSHHAGESMPCGGGDIGLNVWVENNDLLFYLARSGAFDENNGLLKFGRVRVRLAPNPFVAGADFRQELHLDQGCVTISGQGNGHSVVVTVWVDVYAPVVHVEVEATQPVTAEVHYESWRTADRVYEPGENNSHRSYINAPQKAQLWADHISFQENDVVAWHKNREGPTAFDLCVQQQQLESVKSRMWNPLQNLCFGMLLRGKNLLPAGNTAGQYASTPFQGWRLVSRAPASSHQFCVYLHIDSVASAEQWLRTLNEMVGANERANQATIRRKTLAWWRNFWQRSYISILPGSPQPHRAEWRIGRNYQLFRYQLGMNAYGQYPTKFNGGLLTFDPQYVNPQLHFNPDYVQWGGGSFTAQNQRLVYWPMLKSGDTDMMDAQFSFYRRALPNAELRTEVYWGHKGASFTEQIENFGLPVAFEYGWQRPPLLDPGLEWNRWLDHLWETSLEFCLMILDVERYTGADIRRYLPLMGSCVLFFDEHYQQLLLKTQGKRLDEKGQLVFYPGTACETYKNTLNSVVTITALQTVLTRLLQLPSSYLNAEQREYYAGYLRRLPPLPFRERNGHKTIAPAALFDRIQNVEIPQLYPVFPYGLYGIGLPDLQVALDTWHYGVENADQKNHISWHQDAIFCARLGLTEEAAAITTKKLDDSGRRCPTFWGPGHDWVPDHNWGGSGMVGLQEMLLQTVERKLYLFPAWPAAWDVAFRLHAPYQTVLEGRLENGQLSRLQVTPPSRAVDLVLPDWCRPVSHKSEK